MSISHLYISFLNFDLINDIVIKDSMVKRHIDTYIDFNASVINVIITHINAKVSLPSISREYTLLTNNLTEQLDILIRS